MCNLSQGIEDRGIQKGIQKGIRKGEILGAVKTCRSLQMSEDEIVRKLRELFSLTEEEAKAYTAAESEED